MLLNQIGKARWSGVLLICIATSLPASGAGAAGAAAGSSAGTARSGASASTGKGSSATTQANNSSKSSSTSKSGSGKSKNSKTNKDPTPPPPPLVANLINTNNQPQGTAFYSQTLDKSGNVTATALNVQVTPLPNSLVGSSLNVTIDSVVVATVKVAAGSAKDPPSARVTLNSANGHKVPSITPGSLFQIGKSKSPLIGQGTFMVPPEATKNP